MRLEAQMQLNQQLQKAQSRFILEEKDPITQVQTMVALQDKLKRRHTATENMTTAVLDRMESTEQMIHKVQQQIAELQRASGILYATLSVVEKRLEMRAGRPPSELVRDAFQEALEKEKAVILKGRARIAEGSQEGQQILVNLEEVCSELARDRHVLPVDRSARPQELLARARTIEQEAEKYCGDTGWIHRVKFEVERDADRATARTQNAMKNRVAELAEVRKQLEVEVKETSSILAEAEWQCERNQKMLKAHHDKPEPEQVTEDQLSFIEQQRAIFNTPMMSKIRAKIKSASYIGHDGRQLQRFDAAKWKWT